jgi:hypothetical protein
MKSVQRACKKIQASSMTNLDANFTSKTFAKTGARVTKHLFYRFAKTAKK